MRDAILDLVPHIKMYMGVHAYSQLWLTPWAYGGSKPSDYDDLVSMKKVFEQDSGMVGMAPDFINVRIFVTDFALARFSAAQTGVLEGSTKRHRSKYG